MDIGFAIVVFVWCGILTSFVSAMYRQVVPELKKTIADQQRQIDDLKRELRR